MQKLSTWEITPPLRSRQSISRSSVYMGKYINPRNVYYADDISRYFVSGPTMNHLGYKLVFESIGVLF